MGWLSTIAIVTLLSATAEGARAGDVIGAASLVAVPGLAGLVLLPSRHDPLAAALMISAWVAAGLALASASGGAWSPFAALLLVAPALAAALGRWIVAAGAAALTAYVIAAIAPISDEAVGLGLLAPLAGAAAALFACTLLALAFLNKKRAAHDAREAAIARRLAEVSHELRTPLGHILGFADVLDQQVFGPLGERNREYVGLIKLSGARLLDLVNDLLDLSKIDAGRYDLDVSEFDARAIIEDVARFSRHSAESKAIKLETDLPPEPITLRADAESLRRMLLNTVGNALKFTPEGGRVLIAARAVGAMARIDTIDSGPGIPVSERARLGAAYERGESGRAAEGTGLGLSLVRAFADLHGGRLSFHDAEGGGALVRIELPLAGPAG